MTGVNSAAYELTSGHWLPTGEAAYRRILGAIGEAKKTLRFEMYIFRADDTGRRFLAALQSAAHRGVQVQVLIDGFGSHQLPADFWATLRANGGEVRVFNPITWSSFSFRDHRKLVIVDDAIAFVGGFNIGDEYHGDGIARGWRDLGAEVRDSARVIPLAAAFDAMYRAYDLRHRLLHRIHHPLRPAGPATPPTRPTVLLTSPRLIGNQFRRELLHALGQAQNVQLMFGYFLPDFRLRRALHRVVRQGGRVELMLAGRTDVPLAQVAARALYGSLLKRGIKIWEYQPQILHAKLAIVDDAAFVGSSNLDTRSFGINYELMVRSEGAATVSDARKIFASDRTRCVEITLPEWRRSQTWLTRLRGLGARILITRIDPWLARRQLRSFS
jgi:cardiolipin synthase